MNTSSAEARSASAQSTDGGALRVELARKAIHLASSVIPLAYAAGVPRRTMLLALGALAAVALTVELARQRHARTGALFTRAVGGLLREHEYRGWSGASWLLAAYALSVVLFPRAVAVAAMLAAGLGDAAAAIVGRTVARHRARRGLARASGKTFAGSVACAAVTFAAAWLVASLPIAVALVAALAAALAERVPVPMIPVDDNLRVALAAGGAAWIAAGVIGAVA